MKKKLVHIKGYIRDHIGEEGYYPYLGTEKYETDESEILTIIKTRDGDCDSNRIDKFGDEYGFAVENEDKNNFEIVTVDTEELKESIKFFIDDDSFSWAIEFMRRYKAAELSIDETLESIELREIIDSL